MGVLAKNDIINEFFGKTKCHSQLIQYSKGLLKLMLQQKALSVEQLEMIWSTVSKDENTMIELYKVLESIANESTSEITFFTDKIICDSGILKASEVDLLMQITKKTKDTAMSTKVLGFFWQHIYEERTQ